MQYKVTLTGGPTSMYMHKDDVRAADELVAYRQSAKGKGQQGSAKPGDDRSPPWTYWTYLSHNDEVLVVPIANLLKMLSIGGAAFKMPGSRKSLKAAAVTALNLGVADWPLLVQTKAGLVPVAVKRIFDLGRKADFAAHDARCVELGFLLDVRRAAVGNRKHIRVRPKFSPGWQVVGQIEVLDDQAIPAETLVGLLEYCGEYVGLGDWRPSSPAPGPHGRFTVDVKQIRGK